MSKFIQAAMNNRQNAYSSQGTGAKTAKEGKFLCKLIKAENTENRTKTAKMARLTYEVINVAEGDADNKGCTFSEYISESHQQEQMQRRYTQLVDQLLNAGVAESKISDEDDETLFEAVVSAVNGAQKALTKGVEIIAAVKRVKTEKLAENGKPYYNSYFLALDELDDAVEAHEEEKAATEAEEAEESPKEEKKTAKKVAKKTEQKKPEEEDTDLPF